MSAEKLRVLKEKQCKYSWQTSLAQWCISCALLGIQMHPVSAEWKKGKSQADKEAPWKMGCGGIFLSKSGQGLIIQHVILMKLQKTVESPNTDFQHRGLADRTVLGDLKMTYGRLRIYHQVEEISLKLFWPMLHGTRCPTGQWGIPACSHLFPGMVSSGMVLRGKQLKDDFWRQGDWCLDGMECCRPLWIGLLSGIT